MRAAVAAVHLLVEAGLALAPRTWTRGPASHRPRQPVPKTSTSPVGARLLHRLLEGLAHGLAPVREAPGGGAHGHAAALALARGRAPVSCISRRASVLMAAPLRDGEEPSVHGVTRSSVASAPILPATSPSKTTAGARPQAPRQRAVTSETLPSSVVSPALMPCFCSSACEDLARALHVARGAHAHDAGVLARAASSRRSCRRWRPRRRARAARAAPGRRR